MGEIDEVRWMTSDFSSNAKAGETSFLRYSDDKLCYNIQTAC